MQGPRHKHPPKTLLSGKTALNNSIKHVPFTNLTPQTPSEHYWAARAQKAEALLSAREKHYEEVGKVREEEALRRTVRQVELQTLERGYKGKQGSLERLLFILAGIIALLVGALVYLVAMPRNTTQGMNRTVTATTYSLFRWTLGSLGFFQLANSKEHSNRLNLHFHLPSHFTIPILSPWTSVVEQQQSHITNAGVSSSFYLILISLLLIVSSVIIYLRNSRDPSSYEKLASEQQPGQQPSSFRQLLQLFTSGMPSFAFLQTAWGLSHRILRMLGLAPR